MSGAERSIASVLALAPVMPVLTVSDVASAVATARALVDGGLRAIEVTLRTPGALDAIAAIARDVPGAVVGAGTVLDAAQLAACARAGAAFAVSPGCTPRLLESARDAGLPFLPGVATVSELMRARESGYLALKLFPAASVGVAFLRAVAGPFPEARFCPTGGIGEDNAGEWLALPNVVCVGGSWLAPPALVAAGAWDRIAANARRAAALRQGSSTQAP